MTSSVQTQQAVNIAKCQLRSLAPVLWHEIDQVVYEVTKANPSAKGQKLADLIVEEALKYIGSGMGCC